MNNYNRLLYRYIHRVVDGKQPPETRAVYSVYNAKHFADDFEPTSVFEFIKPARSRALIEKMKEEHEAKFFDGMKFLEAARTGDLENIELFLAKGFNVNFQHPTTGFTALHFVAATGTIETLKLLLATKDINYLIRDKNGRLPSLLAAAFNKNPAISRYLGAKEKAALKDNQQTLDFES